jgi:cell division protein FtsB
MRPGSLDADLLDERTRVMLNYAQDDEVVIMHPESAPASAFQMPADPSKN